MAVAIESFDIPVKTTRRRFIVLQGKEGREPRVTFLPNRHSRGERAGIEISTDGSNRRSVRTTGRPVLDENLHILLSGEIESNDDSSDMTNLPFEFPGDWLTRKEVINHQVGVTWEENDNKSLNQEEIIWADLDAKGSPRYEEDAFAAARLQEELKTYDLETGTIDLSLAPENKLLAERREELSTKPSRFDRRRNYRPDHHHRGTNSVAKDRRIDRQMALFMRASVRQALKNGSNRKYV
jgi:hypothetical protein